MKVAESCSLTLKDVYCIVAQLISVLFDQIMKLKNKYIT